MGQISELRQENLNLKAYVKSKLGSGASHTAGSKKGKVDSNRDGPGASASLTRKSNAKETDSMSYLNATGSLHNGNLKGSSKRGATTG